MTPLRCMLGSVAAVLPAESQITYAACQQLAAFAWDEGAELIIVGEGAPDYVQWHCNIDASKAISGVSLGLLDADGNAARLQAFTLDCPPLCKAEGVRHSIRHQ